MSRVHWTSWVPVVAVLSAVALAEARPVIGPGQEALFLAMGDLGSDGPPGARLEGISINRDAVTMTFVAGDRTVRVRLVHPGTAPEAAVRTGRFGLVAAGEGDVSRDLVQALATRIRSLEARFEWAEEPDEPSSGPPVGSVVPFAPALPEDATPFDLLQVPVPALPARAVPAWREARQLLGKGERKGAARKATALARSHPDDPAVLRAAAGILRASGQGRESLALMRKAMDLPGGGGSRESQVELAASLIAAGRAEDAWASLAADPDATPPECRRIQILTLLAREGRIDLADAHAPPAGDGSPRCVRVFHLKLAHALGDDDRVEAAAAAGLRAFPDDEPLLYLWGYHYYARRAMDQAIVAWDRLVARNPRFPAVLGQAGTAYLVARRLDRAGVDAMLERLRANPDDLVASFLAGLGLYYLKDYERVVPLLEPVVRAVPDESRARLYLAMAHYFLGHQDTAERMFEDMEPYAVQDPDIYYCRSLIYRKRDLPRAIREMERFLQVFVGEKRLSFGPEKVQKARSDLERMKRGEVPELNLPGDPLVPAR